MGTCKLRSTSSFFHTLAPLSAIFIPDISGLSFERYIKGDKTDSNLAGKKYNKWNSDRK